MQTLDLAVAVALLYAVAVFLSRWQSDSRSWFIPRYEKVTPWLYAIIGGVLLLWLMVHGCRE